MKKLYVFSSLVIASVMPAAAQVGGYTFSKSTATYAELPSSKQVITTAWTNSFNNLVITAPIEIIMFGIGTDATEFRVTNQGQIIYEPSLVSGNFVISANGGELYGVANSQAAEISYVKEGSYPNSILKVQYKGAGFYTEPTPRTSTVNFQIWVYESNDVIEFRYGPRTVNSSSAIPGDIGLFHDDVGTSISSIELFGGSANPTTNSGTLMDGNHLADLPAANTVYRFAPSSTSVANTVAQTADVRTGYDPGAKNIIVAMDKKMPGTSVQVFNVAGQKVAEHLVSERVTSIPFASYCPGLYIVKTKTPGGIISHKVAVH